MLIIIKSIFFCVNDENSVKINSHLLHNELNIIILCRLKLKYILNISIENEQETNSQFSYSGYGIVLHYR